MCDLADVEAGFASAILSLTGLMGPERQALVRDFLEVVRGCGSSVIKILAHFEPTGNNCGVVAPAGRGVAPPPRDAGPPAKNAACPPPGGAPPGGRLAAPGQRPKTPGPGADVGFNEPRRCACGASFFPFSAAPDGAVNRTAYKTCRLCYMEKRRRGKRESAGGGRPAAILEDVSGLLSPLSPPSPIKLFLPVAPLLVGGQSVRLHEDQSSLRHPRVSVTFELIDGNGLSWGRPAELDDVVADSGA